MLSNNITGVNEMNILDGNIDRKIQVLQNYIQVNCYKAHFLMIILSALIWWDNLFVLVEEQNVWCRWSNCWLSCWFLMVLMIRKWGFSLNRKIKFWKCDLMWVNLGLRLWKIISCFKKKVRLCFSGLIGCLVCNFRYL